MKKNILFITLVLVGIISNAQKLDLEGSFIEVRAEVPIEAEAISHSLSITLNQAENYNNYSDLRYRTFKEQEDYLFKFLDSIGVKTANVEEDKTYLPSSYYKKSKRYNILNVTPDQILSLNEINKNETYVDNRKTKYRMVDSEEALIDKAMAMARKKAEIVAKAVNKKLLDVKYVICSSTVETDFESTYGVDYYSRKYYVQVSFNISD
ncbi:MAG: hypothetical protein ACK5NB_03445 [Flavobacteriaceae bacterium]